METDYCWRKQSEAIMRKKIILLKSKILLEWRNCLNSLSDKCHSCLIQRQQPETRSRQEGKPAVLCELITGGFYQKDAVLHPTEVEPHLFFLELALRF